MASPVRFATVRKELESVGYHLVRIHSSHHIFEKQGSPLVVIPVHHGKVKPVYVREVRKIVAAEKARQADAQTGETGRAEER
jgi:predicted RNA binding protein YcfA (HicA-like mRNA interferase family)